MNFISTLGSSAFQLVLGVVFLIMGILQGVYRRQSELSTWVGRVVFIACGLVFIYNGFHNIHKF